MTNETDIRQLLNTFENAVITQEMSRLDYVDHGGQDRIAKYRDDLQRTETAREAIVARFTELSAAPEEG